MKNNVYKLMLAFTLASASVLSEEARSSDLAAIKQGVVTAKIAGMCGTFKQLVDFQSYSKIDNGMEFIISFLNSEGVRLGYDNGVSLMENCLKVTEKHKAIMSALDGN